MIAMPGTSEHTRSCWQCEQENTGRKQLPDVSQSQCVGDLETSVLQASALHTRPSWADLASMCALHDYVATLSK